MENKKNGLNAFDLKLIAVITMLVDHIGASIVPLWAALNDMQLQYGFGNGGISDVYMVMRSIGRMAFPIYCFFIVEGFHYTHSKKKYALRLLLFALISEVPFDYALNQGNLFDITSNNVFFELLLGLLAIWAIDYARYVDVPAGVSIFAVPTAAISMCFLGGILAETCEFDYGFAGIFTIIVMYLLYEKRIIGFIIGVVILAIMSSSLELFALIMVIPLYFYNGQLGPNNKAIKWGFYAFYPVHLLILGLIRGML